MRDRIEIEGVGPTLLIEGGRYKPHLCRPATEALSHLLTPFHQVLRNMKNDVIEGDPEKILRVTYVMALCRDQEILDPSACWRLIDLSASSAAQWI